MTSKIGTLTNYTDMQAGTISVGDVIKDTKTGVIYTVTTDEEARNERGNILIKLAKAHTARQFLIVRYFDQAEKKEEPIKVQETQPANVAPIQFSGVYHRKPLNIPEGFKFCRHCGRALPVDEFGLWKVSKDGRRTICKDCERSERRIADDNKKKYAAQRKKKAIDFDEMMKGSKSDLKEKLRIADEGIKTLEMDKRALKKDIKRLEVEKAQLEKRIEEIEKSSRIQRENSGEWMKQAEELNAMIEERDKKIAENIEVIDALMHDVAELRTRYEAMLSHEEIDIKDIVAILDKRGYTYTIDRHESYKSA